MALSLIKVHEISYGNAMYITSTFVVVKETCSFNYVKHEPAKFHIFVKWGEWREGVMYTDITIKVEWFQTEILPCSMLKKL